MRRALATRTARARACQSSAGTACALALLTTDRERAIAMFSQMVGALVISRAVDDAAPALSDEILTVNRSFGIAGVHRDSLAAWPHVRQRHVPALQQGNAFRWCLLSNYRQKSPVRWAPGTLRIQLSSGSLSPAAVPVAEPPAAAVVPAPAAPADVVAVPVVAVAGRPAVVPPVVRDGHDSPQFSRSVGKPCICPSPRLPRSP